MWSANFILLEKDFLFSCSLVYTKYFTLSFEEFEDTIKNNGYTTNMYINKKYFSQISKKQNSITYRVNIEEFVNLDDKDLYEMTFDTFNS